MRRRHALLIGLAWQAADFALSGPIKPKAKARKAKAKARTPDILEGGEVVPPMKGHQHECTLIYLHGCSCNARQYLEDGWELPWTGKERWPGLRTVLPDARVMRQPWGDEEPSWHGYVGRFSNKVGNLTTLNQTRQRLAQVVFSEVERLHGEGQRVFLGGASQGCTVALDTYLLQARKLLLGGFVGSVGFVPSDRLGFQGASRALEKLSNSQELRHRPVWLQCATDDDDCVPWRNVVKPSLHRAKDRLPGLYVKEVEGRGHILDEWEGEFVRKFLEEHAKF